MQKCLPHIPVPCLKCQFIVAPNVHLGIGLRSSFGGLRWDQREVVAAERAVDVWLLPFAGGLQHVVADVAERLRRSRPGFVTYFTSAAVKGLYLPSPSDAVEPAFDAKAINVFGLFGSTFARPRPRARVAT